MEGVVSFPLEPRIVSTREAVGATRQAKFFMLVKEAWRYDVPFPRSHKIHTGAHTHTHTHTQKTSNDIIDIPFGGTEVGSPESLTG